MSKTIMSNAQFNKKYRYFEQVSNVTVEFDITDTDQILSQDPPRGHMSRSFMFDNSESIWFLIDKETESVLVDTTEPLDIVDYIKDELQIEIVN